MKELLSNKDSLLGLWANYLVSDVGVDESVVVFNQDETGFIHYHQIDFDLVETFRWEMSNNHLDIHGSYSYQTDGRNLKNVGSSSVDVKGIKVTFSKKESVLDSMVKTIQFSKPLDWTCDENDIFGLMYEITSQEYQNYVNWSNSFLEY